MLNLDGSKSKGSLDSAVAGAVRDYRGMMIDGFAHFVHAGSAEAAKARALLHGLRFVEGKLGREIPYGSKVEVHTDCTLLIQ
ncbi:hypothetical protein NL676_021135 [Syzygium grande]|nr:hypothetical protein NL676_021135 [Syzygium grande]